MGDKGSIDPIQPIFDIEAYRKVFFPNFNLTHTSRQMFSEKG